MYTTAAGILKMRGYEMSNTGTIRGNIPMEKKVGGKDRGNVGEG